MASDLDVLVLGSGQAGVPLAARLAAAGRRVALVERGDLGGTCVNAGCTPTKTLLASARAAHVARTAGRLGIRAGQVAVDLGAVMDRKEAVVARWRDGVRRRLEAAAPRLRVVHGAARFVGPREVEAAGERLAAPVVIVNVGARPAVPPVAGLDRVPFLTSTGALALRALPAHLVVLGGGYVGCELGQLFRRLGADVTVIDPSPHLLAREDEPVSAALEDVFRREGIRLALGAPAEAVEGGAGAVRVRLAGGAVVEGSHLLVATGRRPNTDDLGCDAAGVALDRRGFVEVDARYRTSAEGVYAVGDVTGGPQFTHSSWDDHRILFDLLLGRGRRTRDDRLAPHVVFTDPQVGVVGLSEREARSRAVPFELASLPYSAVARAVEVDEPDGVVRVLVDPRDDRILGAAVVGAEGGELVHVVAALMQAGASARALVDMEMAHPTFCEGLQSAVMTLERFALRP
jgi:pyruvate/2-oxoglutarate dehydrogenase complex dihydrolipoamide dehydrogenase (E3) component